ncbi:cytochrome c oxidase subunit 3 [Hymenobacter guriensis]|uniref:Cytochrome c oxidase subunit III n=1 Tax=Hymenobacter guriensis TaxID=2793065 RepID=A0ABS0L0B3_9BACT|nr:cytochrome c oxidase subunit III [Hymenobacter guriensis]MBG8553503.1 cytochrome c oxidase subunit III [Hymenobacter guriensis]
MSPDQPDKQRFNTIGAGQPASGFARMERVPPLLLMVYLSVGAVGILFVVLLGAYLYTRLRNGVPLGLYALPQVFSLSTIVLLVSSYTLSQAPRLYRSDDLPGLVRCLSATLLLGLLFSGLQVLGWKQLLLDGSLLSGAVTLTGKASATYIYLLSALHVVHLLGGVLFLMALLWRTHHASRDGIRSLFFIRNPYRRMQLRMLSVYWHFIDGLWVVMFALFLFFY